jgi:hypothetical protein
MFKHLMTLVTGIVVGVSATLITVHWQEEELRFELSNPATFGEVIYQNLRIANDGWNPAAHVKVFLNHPSIKPRHVQATPTFNLSVDEPNFLGGYDRIRRGETVTIAFSYKGPAITAAMLNIKSERSIARLKKTNDKTVDTEMLMSVMLLLFIAMALIFFMRPFKKPGADNPGSKAMARTRKKSISSG